MKLQSLSFSSPHSFKWFERNVLDPTSSCINSIVNSPNENMTIKKRLGVQIKEKGTFDKDQWRLCIVDNEFNNGVIKYHNSGTWFNLKIEIKRWKKMFFVDPTADSDFVLTLISTKREASRRGWLMETSIRKFNWFILFKFQLTRNWILS